MAKRLAKKSTGRGVHVFTMPLLRGDANITEEAGWGAKTKASLRLVPPTPTPLFLLGGGRASP